MPDKNIKFAFFGTSEFAVKILEKLIKNGYVPNLVITAPDKPKGRKMIITPPPVKIFAEAHNLEIDQPEKLNSELFKKNDLPGLPLQNLRAAMQDGLIPDFKFDLFIVASYGKIIPKSILDIPKFGALNVHPSLLPKFRGPSPIQSFILSGEEKTGVTIMLMDEQVDHGSILSISNLSADRQDIKSKISNFNAKELEEKLAELGGQMLIEVIPKWINGKIKPQKQDHSQATFTKKIEKEDGLVDLEKDDPEIIYRKFLAFQPWPGIYYFTEKNNRKIRAIITDMELSESGELKIKKVKPEGKNEMTFADFLKGNK